MGNIGQQIRVLFRFLKKAAQSPAFLSHWLHARLSCKNFSDVIITLGELKQYTSLPENYRGRREN